MEGKNKGIYKWKVKHGGSKASYETLTDPFFIKKYNQCVL